MYTTSKSAPNVALLIGSLGYYYFMNTTTWTGLDLNSCEVKFIKGPPRLNVHI